MQNEQVIRPRNNDERKIIPNGEPKVLCEGRIGAIVGFPMLVDTGNGYVEKQFEKFVRPPGTRIIAVQDGKIYLHKEYRLEAKNGFDWRVPGGKVLDTFKEYEQYLGKALPESMILEAGRKELLEEANLAAATTRIFKKSACGATVEWDLYYILAEGITTHEHTHTEGEEITDGTWCTYEEVFAMCVSGAIDEDRTAAVLMQFIKEVR